MDTKTGEIASRAELLGKRIPEERIRPVLSRAQVRRLQMGGRLLTGSGAVVKPVILEELSPRVRRMVERTGRGWVTRNSRCPCGSGRKFKRCCMSK